jgi:hypothetical protein
MYMSQTLVRTQLYLDPVLVKRVKKKLSKQPKKSLAQYVREAMIFYMDAQESRETSLKQRRMSLAGTIKSDLKGDEAINHNDIYTI